MRPAPPTRHRDPTIMMRWNPWPIPGQVERPPNCNALLLCKSRLGHDCGSPHNADDSSSDLPDSGLRRCRTKDNWAPRQSASDLACHLFSGVRCRSFSEIHSDPASPRRVRRHCGVIVHSAQFRPTVLITPHFDRFELRKHSSMSSAT
jgi:hypothetical protein